MKCRVSHHKNVSVCKVNECRSFCGFYFCLGLEVFRAKKPLRVYAFYDEVELNVGR